MFGRWSAWILVGVLVSLLLVPFTNLGASGPAPPARPPEWKVNVLDSAIVEEPQNILDRALRARDCGLKLRFAGGGPRRSKCRHDVANVRRRQGFENDFLAARTQRGEHLARPMRD